ncbi:RNA polymerase sigma 28 subunit [Bacillus phage QCM8]|nr:RNA polymerase sigma 28 subunit [Bacillus phage QCM8]
MKKKYRAIEKEVTKQEAPVKPVAQPKPIEEPIKEEKVIEVTKKRNSPQRKTTKEERARVIELLREGTHTIPEIEQMTGVPYSTVWYYANKQRIDVVKTSGESERQAVNAMIQGGNVGVVKGSIPGGAAWQHKPDFVTRIANAEQKITDDHIVQTTVPGQDSPPKYVTIGHGVSPLRINASKEDVVKLTEEFNKVRQQQLVMWAETNKPAESSFSMTVDLTANGNALPKAEVIGKLEQLIRVVQELPTEKVNFNMKVNN